MWNSLAKNQTSTEMLNEKSALDYNKLYRWFFFGEIWIKQGPLLDKGAEVTGLLSDMWVTAL